MKEYGKNIQGLVDHVCGIEDREKRTASAYTIVEIIKQLNPSLKQENDQKLWDDLYIMSDFRLDVDGPFPMPEKELLGKKPLPVGYPRGEVRFKHYGRNIEKLIEKQTKTTRVPQNQIEVNGVNVDQSVITNLLQQIMSQNYQIKSVQVE